MSAVIENKKSRLAETLSYLTAIVLFALICFISDRKLTHAEQFQDAQVYARGVHAWQTGADAYATSADFALLFVYPPFFLRGAVAASHLFPGHSGPWVYLTLLAVSTLVLPWIVAVNYIRSRWLVPPLALVLFAVEPQLNGEASFLTGNLASILYALVLAAGIPGIRQNKWLLFYIALFFAALIKLPFLTLLLVPFLAGARQFLPSAMTAVFSVAAYLVQRLSMPQVYAAYQNALREQLVVRGDIGKGLLLVFTQAWAHITPKHILAEAIVSYAVTGTVILAVLLMSRRLKNGPDTAHLWLPTVLVSAILANPRMQDYDIDIAFIPAAYLYVEWIFNSKLTRFRAPITAVSIFIFAVLFQRSPYIADSLFLILSITLTVLRPDARTVPNTTETLLAA